MGGDNAPDRDAGIRQGRQRQRGGGRQRCQGWHGQGRLSVPDSCRGAYHRVRGLGKRIHAMKELELLAGPGTKGIPIFKAEDSSDNVI